MTQISDESARHETAGEDHAIAWLHVPAEESLPPEIRQTFEQFREEEGFLNNFFRVLTLTPHTYLPLLGYLVSLIQDEGQLTQRERELIATVVSSINRCEICLTSHSGALRGLLRDEGRDPNQADLAAINYRHARLTSQERALANYAAKLTETPAAVGVEDVQALRDVGYSEAAIFEAVQIAAFFNYTNRITSGTGTVVNPELFEKGR